MDDRLTTVHQAPRPLRGGTRRAVIAVGALLVAAGFGLGSVTNEVNVAQARPNRRVRHRRKDNNRSKSTESSTSIPGSAGQPGAPGQVIDSDTSVT
jgi:hypothetical protein